MCPTGAQLKARKRQWAPLFLIYMTCSHTHYNLKTWGCAKYLL
uniref:Uncharacterized protein n=1 Tax=Anguilla anguilla TaxID=7936 RepID=A0A0E9PHK5_ANGAN